MRRYCSSCKKVCGGSPPEAFTLKQVGIHPDGFPRLAQLCSCGRPLTVLPDREMPGAEAIRHNQRIAWAIWRKKNASKKKV